MLTGHPARNIFTGNEEQACRFEKKGMIGVAITITLVAILVFLITQRAIHRSIRSTIGRTSVRAAPAILPAPIERGLSSATAR